MVGNHSKEKQDDEFESVFLFFEGLIYWSTTVLPSIITQNVTMSIVIVAAKNRLHHSWENKGRFNLGK